ncbi:MAG TPA: tRNA uridine-5-carboxymethylaminomethyl(34) synthesis GTPase MnmE, partial [Chthoniobacteraceae bacterium]|nr:tRNA uridine-5-carboxymethylaminomethyl(34) synthesis GTPase MnmE [Chthoniobacteraceae bacterium]
MNDTIAAISTPFGEGAIALLRLSGERAVAVADGVFRGKTTLAEAEARVQHFGRIVDENGAAVDEVLATVFRAPGSYTGEEVVEIACHGGILVTRRILQLLLAHGARSAEPGEFTQRAFLNGKMDLTQAEAVIDLIRAQTDLALRAATEQLEGRLGAKVRELREELLAILAHVEAYIDFPEEDIDPDTGAALVGKLNIVSEQVAALLRTADQGKILREGVRTVIYGAPNVGKSSLLNLLLGYERAIVSEQPGTTRDTVEEVVNLRGIPLRLIDTAGVRETQDEIERQGIERTRTQVERADLALRIFDASEKESNPRREDAYKEITVLNKCDLGEHVSWKDIGGVRISCKSGEGMEQLADAIFERVMGGGVAHRDASIAINARHQACLQNAERYCAAAKKAIEDQISAEYIAVELRAAL